MDCSVSFRYDLRGRFFRRYNYHACDCFTGPQTMAATVACSSARQLRRMPHLSRVARLFAHVLLFLLLLLLLPLLLLLLLPLFLFLLLLRRRYIERQTNIETVSKVSLGKLLRGRVERIIFTGFTERIGTILN